MPEYKLYYFKARGRAEFMRYILKQAGQDFTEDEITMENWPEKKPKMPMGQVPVLEVDGKMLAQSIAIGRYLANEHGISTAYCRFFPSAISRYSNIRYLKIIPDAKHTTNTMDNYFRDYNKLLMVTNEIKI